MPTREQRLAQRQGPSGSAPSQGVPRGLNPPVFDSVSRDIRALNSSILIITQKMKFLVRNEKILGRNVLVLNKKLKSLEDHSGAGASVGGASTLEMQGMADRFSTELSRLNERLAYLENELQRVKDTYAKLEPVQEMKYVVDSINPLEFVTYAGLDKILEERLNALKQKAEKRV
ncbi:MAG: hypothetical protein J4203_05405 [Candidatus Diapherotrites archaeon]|uniref:Uncharacterized protein n=1 Tax=Candidatus Iainarchaeum sp. TaxID=3101447 RepID=A0A8T4LCC7_9ARCH|nr:hypothetical protein [Candidatus Diapherotrites archaeon]